MKKQNMKNLTLRFVVMVAVSTALWTSGSFALAGSAQAGKVDLTGKWLFTVQTDAGSGTPTVTLKQDGEKLTGHYSSQTLGEADLTGTVKGQEIKFSFTASAAGTEVQVSYSGTIENKDSMKGALDIGGLAQGTFTAKRQ